MKPFVFPKWTNSIKYVAGFAGAGAPVFAVLLVWLGASPETINVGYAPDQPVPYSHALHVGELGLDCRYCHNTVEEHGKAAIPPTETCMNCHSMVRTTDPKLDPIRSSHKTGMSVEWIKVHDLPDYVYFNHSAHVSRGVACVACHGRIDKMEVVEMVSPLSMGWCLDCHRNPDEHIKPKDQVTKMDWDPKKDWVSIGKSLRQEYGLHPSTDCSTCHR